MHNSRLGRIGTLGLGAAAVLAVIAIGIAAHWSLGVLEVAPVAIAALFGWRAWAELHADPVAPNGERGDPHA